MKRVCFRFGLLLILAICASSVSSHELSMDSSNDVYLSPDVLRNNLQEDHFLYKRSPWRQTTSYSSHHSHPSQSYSQSHHQPSHHRTQRSRSYGRSSRRRGRGRSGGRRRGSGRRGGRGGGLGRILLPALAIGGAAALGSALFGTVATAAG